MKRISTKVMIVFVVALGLATALLHVSQRVQKLGDERSVLLSDIGRDLYDTHVLEAEWAYLNSPQNLQMLVDEYLDLEVPDVNSIVQDTHESVLFFMPQQPEDDPLLHSVSLTQGE